MGIGPKTMHGARAIVSIQNTSGDGKAVEVGIFNSVSYSVGITVIPIEVLGNLLPVELVQTGQDPVQVTCSGFRAVGAGPYTDGKVPTVAELLKYDGITLTIYDRQSPGSAPPQPGDRNTPALLTVTGAKCTGYRTTHNAKGVSDLEITYMGIKALDETAGPQAQTDVGAIVYPIATPTP
jgi:hypothetical protein